MAMPDDLADRCAARSPISTDHLVAAFIDNEA